MNTLPDVLMVFTPDIVHWRKPIRTLALAILVVVSRLLSAYGESAATLKSPETLQGTILSDATNDVLHTGTQPEAQELTAYLALSKFRLIPDQEQSKDFYTQWIAAFEKFLSDYPKSDKARFIRPWLEACQTELNHVTAGEVKFQDKWMTPVQKDVQKKPLSIKKQLTSLKAQLAEVERQDALMDAAMKQQLGNRSQQTSSDWRAYDILLAKEKNLEIKISQVQHEYEVAQRAAQDAAQPQPPASPPPKQESPVASPVVVMPKQESPVATPVVVPKKWVVRNWMIATVGVILLAVALPLIARPLINKRKQIKAERDRQRRVARQQLKTIFDRIFVDGQRPAGKNTPAGEIIPIGQGQDASGGGRWFVVSPVCIWAVQNNGKEDDNWALNNVATDGPGAIGACVAAEPELDASIRTLANATR